MVISCIYLRVVGNISTITASKVLIMTLAVPIKRDARVIVVIISREKYKDIAIDPEQIPKKAETEAKGYFCREISIGTLEGGVISGLKY